ncbi:MAG: DNA alkylation repair protein [Burkholderiales bacterium]|nr:DNA alkylation repair protein [Burkholderiales bacterium]MDE1928075.1 DNA alkylation repair protein [Burkholderiales bacterium]MDE2158531.1 DNA alkylation repair protein [Burkholderiales bacterium]MDE2504693.1 DNA alkylation repair protein [Burkholderiales bacterium]
MAADGELIAALRAGLVGAAQPQRAPAMQAYMQSALPFHGVATSQRRQIVATALAAHPVADAASLAATARRLWREATHREQRYLALDLLRSPRHRALVGIDLLPLLQALIVEGAWWDYVDEISGRPLARLLEADPAAMKPVLRRWACGDDLWLRRAAMLGQRSLKTGFDAVLFYDTLLPSLAGGRHADEFFIRKGMGWALRERSYAAPDEVQAFCSEYRDRLSPLTRREALRAIVRQRPGTPVRTP